MARELERFPTDRRWAGRESLIWAFFLRGEELFCAFLFARRDWRGLFSACGLRRPKAERGIKVNIALGFRAGFDEYSLGHVPLQSLMAACKISRHPRVPACSVPQDKQRSKLVSAMSVPRHCRSLHAEPDFRRGLVGQSREGVIARNLRRGRRHCERSVASQTMREIHAFIAFLPCLCITN